jgi:hypothetical protein
LIYFISEKADGYQRQAPITLDLKNCQTTANVIHSNKRHFLNVPPQKVMLENSIILTLDRLSHIEEQTQRRDRVSLTGDEILF